MEEPKITRSHTFQSVWLFTPHASLTSGPTWATSGLIDSYIGRWRKHLAGSHKITVISGHVLSPWVSSHLEPHMIWQRQHKAWKELQQSKWSISPGGQQLHVSGPGLHWVSHPLLFSPLLGYWEPSGMAQTRHQACSPAAVTEDGPTKTWDPHNLSIRNADKNLCFPQQFCDCMSQSLGLRIILLLHPNRNNCL